MTSSEKFEIKKGVFILIDEADIERVREHRWRISRTQAGRWRLIASIKVGQRYRTYSLPHFLLGDKLGHVACQVDLSTPLDFRRANLAFLSLKDRQQRIGKTSHARSSRYKGVSVDAGSDKWRASIEIHGRSILLGLFTTEETAARAYNEAVVKWFGPFAFLNKIDQNP